MERSVKVLIAGSACFIAGFLIFAVALFSRLDNVEIYAGIAFALIIIFLVLTYVSMVMRSKEKIAETNKDKKKE